MAMPLASFPGFDNLLATTAPIPKNAPCGKPDKNRNIIKELYPVAKADKVLKTVNHNRSNANTLFAGHLLPKPVNIGAPTTTPKAYAEIKCPASGILTSNA